VFNLADKTTGGLLGVFVDISTQKKLEQDLAKANERMEDELNVGAEIQMSMLPLEFPAFPDRKEFSIFASLYPAREVGGDFYDFFFIDKNKFCFVMADVSGKGVPAALFMAVTKTLIKSRSNNDYSTASIMKHVNDEISADNDSGMFVTVFMGIADLETGKVLYTNAGHNPPYIKRNNGDVEIIDARHGLVVGAMDEVEYKEDELQLQKGDQIFMFTDGVTEAMNTKLELFDEKRLEEVLGGRKFSSSEDITHSVFKAVKKFEDGADQFDDITIMAFKYLGVDKDEIINYFELEVTNDLPELQILTDKLEIFIADNHIDPSFNSHLNLVFDELLNNIISYGYNDSEIHIIIIKVELLKDRLKITISDDGTPFNPFTEKKPDTNLGMDERDIGGLGIHLVRSVMDKMDYKRQIDKNIVILEKQLTTD
ncbi:MAG: SpoIIE family protein phosphatase, partial [Candidatus Marinimicrobia bacterium]|nr:SpoIIE family protein phosphatase [Candidatus Neomarinimicrobiota bacterium]